MPWRRECLPTPVFLLGGFHGQGSLAGYSPWGCKESVILECEKCWDKAFENIFSFDPHSTFTCLALFSPMYKWAVWGLGKLNRILQPRSNLFPIHHCPHLYNSANKRGDDHAKTQDFNNLGIVWQLGSYQLLWIKKKKKKS